MSLVFALLLACGGDPAAVVVDSGADAPAMFERFESAEECAACHPAHYDEWRQSMHAYATRSPVFEAMAGKAFRDTAGEVGSFCTRCHSIIGDLEGDPGDVTFDERSPLAREGVTCDICHTAVHADAPLGNANLSLDPTGPRFGPLEDAADDEHDVGMGALQTSSELCASCHDVYMYPGLAIEQAYTEYVDSPAKEAGVRCQDCHMGPEPGAVSQKVVEPIAVVGSTAYPARERSTHRFVGPDYALVDDFPYPDDLAASAVAQAEALDRIEILLKNAARISDLQLGMDQGQAVVDVTLESLVAGHRVPTGFTSERQLWLDVTVRDAAGAVLLRSGDLDSYGDLRDTHSWDVHAGDAALDEQLVNLQSVNRTLARKYQENGQFNGEGQVGEATFPFQAQEIERHSLEPFEQRTVRYRTAATSTAGLSVEVALRYRNLPPYVLRALGVDELVERLVIFTLDERSEGTQ